MYIKPLVPFDRTLATAPDKSITHRAVMVSAFARGRTVIINPLLGGDCYSTIRCMTALGAKIEVTDKSVYITGTEKFADTTLDAGNSGTTARLLTGLLAGRGITAQITGDESLSLRPMGRVVEPLKAMGANITTDGGRLPVIIFPARLTGINYTLPHASAQVKSALLLAGLSADGVTRITEKIKSRDHSEIMLKAMGADIKVNGNTVSVRAGGLTALPEIYVPGDISSAAFLLGLAAVVKNSRIKVTRVGLNPTRTGIIEVLKHMGADIIISGYNGASEPYGDITLTNTHLKPFNITAEVVPSLIDELPLLAALACYAEGRSVISGAEELKVKESNRIDTTAAALRALGGDIETTNDGLIINGRGGLPGGGTVDSAGDHRIAMTAAVAAAGSGKGGTIIGAQCSQISYPGFFELISGGLGV